MKVNAKYGIVAALTMAAFVAPSVGAYTAGTPNDYTDAEQKAIDKCIDSVKLDGKVEVTKTSGGYSATAVENTIYAAYSVTATDDTPLKDIKKDVCVVDLKVNGTLVEESSDTTDAKKKVAAEQQKLAEINGGGRKSTDVDDTMFDDDDAKDDYDNTKAETSKWYKDGVYTYKGNYKGTLKVAEEALTEAKDDLKVAQKALDNAKADFKKANPSADEDTIKEAVKSKQDDVDAAQEKIHDAEQDIADIKKDRTDAEDALKEAKADLKESEAKDKKTAAEDVSEKAKDAAKDADDAVKALEEKIAQAKDNLKTESDPVEAKKASKAIAEDEEKLKELKTKAADLNKIANNAEKAADVAIDEAREALSISTATVSGVKRAYAYTGKAIAPAITVAKGGSTLVAGTDYTVAYASNTKVGTATITITGKGDYSGTKTVKFYIDPAKSSIKKVAVAAKKMTVTVKKGTAASGVQIAYRVKGTSKWSYTKTTSTSKAIKSLKKGKKYQVVVRSYTTKNGKVTNYSGWSATKTSAKIK